MCISCGCDGRNVTHGEDRHITLEDLEAAVAKPAEIPPREVAKTIEQGASEPK